MSEIRWFVGRVVFEVGHAALEASDRAIARCPRLSRWFDRKVHAKPGTGSGRGYGVGRF